MIRPITAAASPTRFADPDAGCNRVPLDFGGVLFLSTILSRFIVQTA